MTAIFVRFMYLNLLNQLGLESKNKRSDKIMKAIRIISATIIISAILFASCKNKSSESVNELKKRTELTKETPKGKYAIKSGIVEYKTKMMGMDAKQKLTFDDYGKNEITEVMLGAEIHTVTLNKDGFVYNYDLIKKIGTKRPATLVKTSDIDFENASKEMMKEMNLKKEGTEKFLGRDCEKVSIDNEKMKMKGNYLIYKGIPLRVNTDLGSIKMNLLAEKIEENPVLSNDIFTIPADIKISEK